MADNLFYMCGFWLVLCAGAAAVKGVQVVCGKPAPTPASILPSLGYEDDDYMNGWN